jgi:hypothetical protein
MIMVDWSSAQINKLEVEGFNHLILEVEYLDDNLFGIEAFGWEFELSLMSFL